MTLAQLGFEPLQPPSNKKGREGTLAPSRSCEFTQDSERRSNPLSHRPWNLSHLRLAQRQHEEHRTRTAIDCYFFSKPSLERTFDRPHPKWTNNETGNKLVRKNMYATQQEASISSFDTHRPQNKILPPWKHNLYPRCQNTVANCMSRSFFAMKCSELCGGVH